MKDYVILTDSSCDMPKSVMDDLGVAFIDLEVTVEGEDTRLNSDIEIKEFYEKLRSKKMAKTAAINMERLKDFFEQYIKMGFDVLYIGFSSGLSVTFNNSRLAAEELSEAYPDVKVTVIDSLCASSGQGLLVTLAARKKATGASIDEVADYVRETIPHLCHWFTVDDLFFLKRGGRVSAATAVLGSMLAIKPVLHVDDEGHLINVAKARGRNGSIRMLADKMKETAIDPQSQTVYISHGDCYEEAKVLADIVKNELGVTDILISDIGPVIGAHSGPGTIALFFIGTKR